MLEEFVGHFFWLFGTFNEKIHTYNHFILHFFTDDERIFFQFKLCGVLPADQANLLSDCEPVFAKIWNNSFGKLGGVGRGLIYRQNHRYEPLSSVYSNAFSIMTAFCIRPRWRSIPKPLNSSAVGLAIFLPAISGSGSVHGFKDGDVSPMLALGSKPNPPTSPAQRSLTISPCRLVNTTTSNKSGRLTSFIHRSSTITSSAFSSGYSLLLHKILRGIIRRWFSWYWLCGRR